MLQGEPAAADGIESTPAMPAGAAIVAEGMLATVQRTLQHNTAFDGASTEVFSCIIPRYLLGMSRSRKLDLDINLASGFRAHA